MTAVRNLEVAALVGRFHPAVVARLRWRIENPSRDEVALTALKAMGERVGRAADTDLPGTWGAVLAVAQGKRDRLEAAYRRLLDD
jgi:hypothetical protein